MTLPGNNLVNFLFVFLVVFFVILVIVFLYTQFFVEKKKIIIFNDEGKRISVQVEIAADPFKRSRGLMFRSNLSENEGMLFIFQKPDRYGFWMVNTTIPLDAIFFDENKNVVDVIGMEPCHSIAEQCKVYSPRSPVLYVLEVNKGFAEKNKIGNKSRFVFEND